MKIAVITVSDRAAQGLFEDLSGPAVRDEMARELPEAEMETEIVPDGVESVLAAFMRHPGADWIFTTGGTGPAPRDATPEATARYCDRLVPGIAEFLRMRSLEETPFAVFSRGVAGMRGRQYVVNFPGSEKGARLCARLMAPLLRHGMRMAGGESH